MDDIIGYDLQVAGIYFFGSILNEIVEFFFLSLISNYLKIR